jgi:hypothetical protein
MQIRIVQSGTASLNWGDPHPDIPHGGSRLPARDAAQAVELRAD